MSARLPRYPIYIPSKGRARRLLTARMFRKDGVPFKVVVEPSQVESYTEAGWGKELLVLPENSRGLVYSRNFITNYSRAAGEERHWQFDDDIRAMVRHHQGYRLPCDSKLALCAAEDFVDQYENVALMSFNAEYFVPMSNGVTAQRWPPFYVNARCYTNVLFLNKLTNNWREPINEDTDMSLQVLADGWCTILFNAFTMRTVATAAAGGGQTQNYVLGDGRLKMSRILERRWPGVVTVYRRYGHAQHKIAMFWQQFTTPLKRREGVALDPKDYAMTLTATKEIKSPTLRDLYERSRETE